MMLLIKTLVLNLLKGFIIDELTSYVSQTDNEYDDEIVQAVKDYFDS